MIEFKKILQGIVNQIEAKEAVEVIAAERMDSCNACPHNSKNSSNNLKTFFPAHCMLCNCKLSWKVRSLSSQCPDIPPRWKAIDGISDKESNKIDEIIGND